MKSAVDDDTVFCLIVKFAMARALWPIIDSKSLVHSSQLSQGFLIDDKYSYKNILSRSVRV